MRLFASPTDPLSRNPPTSLLTHGTSPMFKPKETNLRYHPMMTNAKKEEGNVLKTAVSSLVTLSKQTLKPTLKKGVIISSSEKEKMEKNASGLKIVNPINANADKSKNQKCNLSSTFGRTTQTRSLGSVVSETPEVTPILNEFGNPIKVKTFVSTPQVTGAQKVHALGRLHGKIVPSKVNCWRSDKKPQGAPSKVPTTVKCSEKGNVKTLQRSSLSWPLSSTTSFQRPSSSSCNLSLKTTHANSVPALRIKVAQALLNTTKNVQQPSLVCPSPATSSAPATSSPLTTLALIKTHESNAPVLPFKVAKEVTNTMKIEQQPSLVCSLPAASSAPATPSSLTTLSLSKARESSALVLPTETPKTAPSTVASAPATLESKVTTPSVGASTVPLRRSFLFQPEPLCIEAFPKRSVDKAATKPFTTIPTTYSPLFVQLAKRLHPVAQLPRRRGGLSMSSLQLRASVRAQLLRRTAKTSPMNPTVQPTSQVAAVSSPPRAVPRPVSPVMRFLESDVFLDRKLWMMDEEEPCPALSPSRPVSPPARPASPPSCPAPSPSCTASVVVSSSPVEVPSSQEKEVVASVNVENVHVAEIKPVSYKIYFGMVVVYAVVMVGCYFHY